MVFKKKIKGSSVAKKADSKMAKMSARPDGIGVPRSPSKKGAGKGKGY